MASPVLLHFSDKKLVPQIVTGPKYLLPYDADFDNFFASALSNSDFNRLLLSIKSKRLVVFMDSCYSGGVSEKKARDVKIVEDPYEKMAEGEGRLVIAASQPDQRSFEDKKLGHGIFTHHLIEALSGAAYSDKDGYVKAMEVYKYLSENVPETARRLAGGIQEPILRGDLKTDFVLTVNRKRLEEIKQEYIKKRNLKRLSDWYHDEKLGPAQYELACGVIESSFEELSGDDKKVLKSLNDLLSGKISISTFQHDVGLIKGLEEPPVGKPKVEEERIKGEEDEKKKKRIIELCSQAQKLFVEKKYTGAIAKWQEVLKLDSENRKAIERIEEAKRISEESEKKKRKIDELNTSAQQLYDKGKYREAIDKGKDVLNLDSGNRTAKEGIKTAEENLKEREKISELSSQAQKLFEEKRYAEAIAKWQEVLKLDSENHKAIKGIEESERILEELEKKKRKVDELNTSAKSVPRITEWKVLISGGGLYFILWIFVIKVGIAGYPGWGIFFVIVILPSIILISIGCRGLIKGL